MGQCAEGFVGQTCRFKFYSEFNRKLILLSADEVGLRGMFIVGHATHHDLRSFGCVEEQST